MALHMQRADKYKSELDYQGAEALVHGIALFLTVLILQDINENPDGVDPIKTRDYLIRKSHGRYKKRIALDAALSFLEETRKAWKLKQSCCKIPCTSLVVHV